MGPELLRKGRRWGQEKFIPWGRNRFTKSPERLGKHLRPAWRSEARGEFPVRFGHPRWQVAGAEQPGFEYFLRVERQAVQPAD